MADGNHDGSRLCERTRCGHASKDAAIIMLRTESMRLKNFGPLPSMRNPSTRRVVRRAWTVGRLTGSLPFPRPCKLIQDPGFSKRHSHDGRFTPPRRSPSAIKICRITCVRTGRPPRRRSGRLDRRHRGDGEHHRRDDGGAVVLQRIRRWRWYSRAPLARFRPAAPYAAAC
jgi:hypothetical protein